MILMDKPINNRSVFVVNMNRMTFDQGVNFEIWHILYFSDSRDFENANRLF